MCRENTISALTRRGRNIHRLGHLGARVQQGGRRRQTGVGNVEHGVKHRRLPPPPRLICERDLLRFAGENCAERVPGRDPRSRLSNSGRIAPEFFLF